MGLGGIANRQRTSHDEALDGNADTSVPLRDLEMRRQLASREPEVLLPVDTPVAVLRNCVRLGRPLHVQVDKPLGPVRQDCEALRAAWQVGRRLVDRRRVPHAVLEVVRQAIVGHANAGPGQHLFSPLLLEDQRDERVEVVARLRSAPWPPVAARARPRTRGRRRSTACRAHRRCRGETALLGLARAKPCAHRPASCAGACECATPARAPAGSRPPVGGHRPAACAATGRPRDRS